MGKVADINNHAYNPVQGDESSSLQARVEVVVPVASTINPSAANRASLSETHALAWTDTYYENEPDVVAVFDLDSQAIQDYQATSVIKSSSYAIVFFMVSVLCMGEYELVPLAVITLFSGLLFAIMAAKACQRLHASGKGGLHMAITSSSIRYDQEDPLVLTEISLKSVSSCTVSEKKIRKFPWSAVTVVHLVQIHIVGAKVPKTYIGLKDARNFSRVVMSVKNRPQSSQDYTEVV